MSLTPKTLLIKDTGLHQVQVYRQLNQLCFIPMVGKYDVIVTYE